MPSPNLVRGRRIAAAAALGVSGVAAGAPAAGPAASYSSANLASSLTYCLAGVDRCDV